MKKTFLVAVCAIGAIGLYAQTIKTYSGVYPHAEGALKGEVKYSYTEDQDGLRTKQGPFFFSTPEGRKLFTIQGTYQNGKKEGKWTTKAVNPRSFIRPPKASNNIDGILSEGTCIMSGNFVNNERNGLWTYMAGKIVDNTSKSSTKSSAYFTDGLLDGEFRCDYQETGSMPDLYALNVVGSFYKGLIDGKWAIKYIGSNKMESLITLVFDQGKLISSQRIATATGDRFSPISKELGALQFGPDTEIWKKFTLFTCFQKYIWINPALIMWLGDPSLERYEKYAETEEYTSHSPGFVYVTESYLSY